jgi:hypothetical protein
MSHQVIRQPDGRLAVWSTVVDDFVIKDASPGELLDHYAEEAAERARGSAERVVDRVLAGRAQEVYGQFTMTYAEAEAKAKAIH